MFDCLSSEFFVVLVLFLNAFPCVSLALLPVFVLFPALAPVLVCFTCVHLVCFPVFSVNTWLFLMSQLDLLFTYLNRVSVHVHLHQLKLLHLAPLSKTSQYIQLH